MRVKIDTQQIDGLIGGLVRSRENFMVVQRAEARPGQQEAQDKAEIADAVDQKGLRGGGARGRPFVPVSDQQIGAEAHGFPKDEQLEEIVGQHQHQHREGK
jgi:hypothetical protein